MELAVYQSPSRDSEHLGPPAKKKRRPTCGGARGLSARRSLNPFSGTELYAGEDMMRPSETEARTKALGASRVEPLLAEQNTRGSGGEAGEALL